jgi:DNA-binding response OmpR family regulator
MPTVLVVDDAADLRFLFRAVLSRAGFDVVEASSGREVLAMLDQDPVPDVVLLDVQMPDMDGWDTLTAIRARVDTHELPVILCTVKASEEDVHRGWMLGCDGYVTKPFDIVALREEVAAVVSRSAEQRLAVRAVALAAPHDYEIDRTSIRSIAWTFRP